MVNQVSQLELTEHNIHVHQESNASSLKITTGCRAPLVTTMSQATTLVSHVLKVSFVLCAEVHIKPVLIVDLVMELFKVVSSPLTALMFNL